MARWAGQDAVGSIAIDETHEIEEHGTGAGALVRCRRFHDLAGQVLRPWAPNTRTYRSSLAHK